LGYLSFESIVNRDYPVVFAIFIFSRCSDLSLIWSPISLTWIDPRIDFETREYRQWTTTRQAPNILRSASCA